MKFKTVREGEQAVIYNVNGEGRHIEGPKRVFLFRKRLVKLNRYIATHKEYLVIRYLDGQVVHKIGPCVFFRNPLEHENVRVCSAIELPATRQIVVYSRQSRDIVTRRVISGPELFFPTANEWMEQFSWHGEDADDKGRLIPNHRQFSQLPTTPEHFYYNVRDVRSIDDTTMRIKLMLTYQIKDILTLLEATQDPIADMVNAVCADVVALVSKITYAEFLSQTWRLSELSSYPELVQRAARVGLTIHSVVYRGYHASDQLQEMHNRAIEARTQLRLQAEVQTLQDKLAKFILDCERKRVDQSQLSEQRRQEHSQQLAKLKQESLLTCEQLRSSAEQQRSASKTQLHLELQAAKQAEEQERLKQLEKLDVDLTSVLVSQAPPQPHEQISLVSHKTISSF